jgi:hypothetical protein
MQMSSNSRVVDLDRMATWPQDIRSHITPHIAEIAVERTAQNDFDMSGDRWFKPSPPTPRTDDALRIINASMSDHQLRVFHATRLLSADAVIVEGLRPLDLKSQIARVRTELARRELHDEVAELDAAVSAADLSSQSYACREQQVWFTPLRRSLHDGGCDIFFEHWGGEAIQRLTQSKATLTKTIRTLGSPAVIVGNIPAFGACERSALRLAPAMLSLLLEHAGHEFSIESWDVMLKRNVPADWIEAVLPHTHPSLAA